MMYFDQHVHSYYSFDSSEPIENFIARAFELGLDTIVFTNHIDLDTAHIADWNFDIEKEQAECFKLSKEYNINIYPGIEIGYVPEKKECINKLIKSHHFNVVNLSLHVVNDIDLYFYEAFEKYGVDDLLNLYFDSMINMLNDMDDFDVLSHLDYGFKTVKQVDHELQLSKFEDKVIEIMKIVIKKEKALEINMKVQSAINDYNHMRYILRLYKSLGGKYLTLSSDAHRASNLYREFDYIFGIIKEEGFDELVCFIDRKKHLVKI